jgi:hypothetical protein
MSWEKKYFGKQNRGMQLPLWESILREGNMAEELEEKRLTVTDDKGNKHASDYENSEERNQRMSKLRQKNPKYGSFMGKGNEACDYEDEEMDEGITSDMGMEYDPEFDTGFYDDDDDDEGIDSMWDDGGDATAVGMSEDDMDLWSDDDDDDEYGHDPRTSHFDPAWDDDEELEDTGYDPMGVEDAFDRMNERGGARRNANTGASYPSKRHVNPDAPDLSNVHAKSGYKLKERSGMRHRRMGKSNERFEELSPEQEKAFNKDKSNPPFSKSDFKRLRRGKSNESMTDDSYRETDGSGQDTYEKNGTRGGQKNDPTKPSKTPVKKAPGTNVHGLSEQRKRRRKSK